MPGFSLGMVKMPGFSSAFVTMRSMGRRDAGSVNGIIGKSQSHFRGINKLYGKGNLVIILWGSVNVIIGLV